LKFHTHRNSEEPEIRQSDLEYGAFHQLRGRLAMVDFDRRVVPQRGFYTLYSIHPELIFNKKEKKIVKLKFTLIKGIDDVVLSAEQKAKLQRIIQMEKARQILFSEWGYSEKVGIQNSQNRFFFIFNFQSSIFNLQSGIFHSNDIHLIFFCKIHQDV
jgi:hypothetical protein